MTYMQNLWLFSVLLVDMFFVIANALTGGKLRGLAATAGVMLGGAFHTLFGAFFVGVITKLAPALITLILFAGAAYMLWIGLTLIRSSITVDDFGKSNTRSNWAAFRQGFITCMLNPKAYVFVLAVYPVFIQARFGAVWAQALVMGFITILTQMIIYGGLGLAAAKSRKFLLTSPTTTIWIGRAAGALFICVAALTIWHAVTV
jgi:threonine/homoserine/homoserine lactone efflux protein